MSLYLSGYSAIHDNALWYNGTKLFEANKNIIEEAPVYLKFDYPKFYKMDNLCKTGFIAVETLLASAPIQYAQAEEVALVVATREGCMETDIRFEKSSREIASPALFVYTLPNIILGELSIRHGIKGENACFVFDIFDSDFISDYVDSIFNQGQTKVCIVGWVNYWNNRPEAFFGLVEESVEFNDIPFSQALKSNYNSIWKN